MNEILELVAQREAEFVQLPFFHYLADGTLPPRQRLLWTPWVAHIALGFGDMWSSILRREPTTDPIQARINQHTREDEHHWKWYLGDMQRLGFLDQLNFSQSLQFLWNEHTPKTRQVCLKLAGLTYSAEPVVVLAAIEAIEATAGAVFRHTAPVIAQLSAAEQQGLFYFAQAHIDEDESHSTFDSEEHGPDSLTLTPAQREQAIFVVEQVFICFREAMEEVMAYAAAQLDGQSVVEHRGAQQSVPEQFRCLEPVA
jgi:hypothetical protein